MDYAIQCAWCKEKIKVNGEWVFASPLPTVMVSHSICPECNAARKLEEELCQIA